MIWISFQKLQLPENISENISGIRRRFRNWTGRPILEPTDVIWYTVSPGPILSIYNSILYLCTISLQVSIADCKLCSPGQYCPSSGAASPAADCSSGYYCPPGQNTSTPFVYRCPVGHYCPTASQQPIRCENGTYQDEEFQAECKTCPSGKRYVMSDLCCCL